MRKNQRPRGYRASYGYQACPVRSKEGYKGQVAPIEDWGNSSDQWAKTAGAREG